MAKDLGLLDDDPARSFEELRLTKSQDFRASLEYYDHTEAKKQELRQLGLVEPFVYWSVSMAREDFPDVKTNINLKFKMSSAQTAWLPLLSEVRKKLGLEFIFVIVEREDLTPVYNILTMRDQGEYYVRQRESSAVLEVLTTRKVPQAISWPITQHVVSAQEELRWVETKRPQLVNRVKDITSRPKIREQERHALMDLIKVTEPEEVMAVMEGIMTTNLVGDGPPKGTLDEKTGEEITWDPQIDLVNVHRMALESLMRMCAQGKANAVAEHASKFIIKTIYRYMDETDIVVVGLKVLNDYGSHFHRVKAQVLHVIMDCMQAFSPPAPIQRPRKPKRLIPSANDLLQQELDAQRLEEERLKAEREERERLEREAEAARVLAEKLRIEEEERQAREALEEKMRKRAARKAKKANSKAGQAAAARAAQMKKEADARKAAAEAAKPKEKKSLFKGGVGTKTEKPPEVELPTIEELGLPDPETMPIIPLPPVPGVTFRGISRKLDYKTCLLHSAAAIRSFVHGPISYRELFYGMYVHEELADLCLVMQAFPDIISYIVWTLDRVYSDGFITEGRFDDLNMDAGTFKAVSRFADQGTALGFEKDVVVTYDEEASQGSEALMGLSYFSAESLDRSSTVPGEIKSQEGTEPWQSEKGARKGEDWDEKNQDDDLSTLDGNESVDPVSGKVIEAISDVTPADVDIHNMFDELEPPTDEYINYGNEAEEDVFKAPFPSPRSTTGSNITVIAVDLQKEKEVKAAEKAKDAERKAKKKAAQESVGKPKAKKVKRPKTATELAKEEEEEKLRLELEEEAKKKEELDKLTQDLKNAHGPTEAELLGVDVNRELEQNYRERYLSRPEEVVAMAFGMIANHPDVHMREKETADKWLYIWDDATLDYKMVVQKGADIGSL